MTLIYLFGGLRIVFLLAIFIFRNRVSSPPPGTTDEDIYKLIQEGHELQALKWYRALHSVSLVEAKLAIETLKAK